MRTVYNLPSYIWKSGDLNSSYFIPTLNLFICTEASSWMKGKSQFLQKSWKTGLVERLRQGIRNWLRNTWHLDVDISLDSRKPKRSWIGKLGLLTLVQRRLCFFVKRLPSANLLSTPATAVVVERSQLLHWDCQLWAQGIDGKNNCMSKDPAAKRGTQTVGTGPQQKAFEGERQ